VEKISVDVQGECVGVGFSKRGKNDNHALINIHVEDDEMWFKEMTLSSAWIDDFISTLEKAKYILDSEFDEDSEGYGYQYKE
jgi:hypothetical protein